MIDLDTIEDIETIINIYETAYHDNTIKNKIKESRSIDFLKVIMKNKSTNCGNK
jgi:hypothetical protein